MAGSVRVVLKSVFDDSGIKSAQKSLQNIGNNIDRVFKSVAIATAAAGAAIGSFAKSSVDAASDLAESTNAVNVAFGDAAEAVLAIGETSAKSLGLARNEFNQAAVRFSAFAERVVGEGGDVSQFVQEVTQRAADFASVFNIEVSEALRVFQSGLAGEAEPLKRFGINLLDSEVRAYAMANGIGEVGRQLTETEKVQARYGLLLQSTAKTAGDFANTSDGLANSQRILRAQFTDLQAEIGNALLPVVTELLRQFADRLLPKMIEFGNWLKSPQGTAAIDALAEAFSKAFDAVFDFIDFIVRNWRAILDFSGAIGAALVALRSYVAVVQVATAAQVAFNVATAANPYVLAGLALSGIAVGMYQVYQAAKDTAPAVQEVNNEILRTESAFVTSATAGSSAYKGLIPDLEYAGENLDRIRISTEAGAAEFARFNNIKLNSLRNEISATANAQAALNQTAMSFTRARQGLLTGQASGRGAPSTPARIPTSGSSGPSLRERQRDLVANTQEQIDSAVASYNKTVANARKQYDKAIASAEKRYAESVVAATTARDQSLARAAEAHAENIARIQSDFAKRQAAVIQQSIDRLRDAYRNAVQVNVADLFGTEEVGKSVDSLVTSLQDRLTASRRLLDNSAQLASQGFSQTFIEQVVQAGVETGNELAAAILEATPETQAELQSLFSALETESNTGMDNLSQTIYEKTGLATDALKELYNQNNVDLVTMLQEAEADYVDVQTQILQTFDDAMQAATQTRNDAFALANEQLNEALAEAASALNEQLAKIKSDFDKKIAEMGGAISGLNRQIDSLFGRIAQANAAAASAAAAVAAIPPAPRFDNVAATQRKTGTTININVKTDATQSTAQVGKTIAKTVNDSVRSGGSGIVRRKVG